MEHIAPVAAFVNVKDPLSSGTLEDQPSFIETPKSVEDGVLTSSPITSSRVRQRTPVPSMRDLIEMDADPKHEKRQDNPIKDGQKPPKSPR